MKQCSSYSNGETPYPLTVMAVLVDGEFDQERQKILNSQVDVCSMCPIGDWFKVDPIVLLRPDEVGKSLEILEQFTVTPLAGEPVEFAPYLPKLWEAASYVANR